MRFRMVGLSVVAVLGLVTTGLAGVAAQDASPAAADGAFTDVGDIPEIQVTLTDSGLEGVPSETQEGWHLVTFTNSVTPTGDPFEDAWSVEFVMLPEGMVAADLAALFQEAPEGEGATPAMEMGEGAETASPMAGGEDPFAFLYETYLAGGPGALQGETVQGLIHLEAGNYAVLAFGFSAPVELTVTEAGDAAAPATPESGVVSSDVVITETGTSGTFDFSVEAGAFAGGPAVVEIYNDSDQPHFVFAIRSEGPVTEDEIMAVLMAEEGGTPPAGGPDPSGLSPAFGTGTQSPNTTQFLAVDLAPGYYVFLCFVGDPNQGGVPHSFAGMIEIVPVGV
jgi:hypothetical protein